LRSIISNQLHWVALGVGILILAAGISVSVWSPQRDQGAGPVPGAKEGRPAGLETVGELPGLPGRNTSGVGVSGDVSPAPYGTSVSNSAELDSGRVGLGLTAADDAALSDSAALDADRAGRGLITGDDVGLSDSAVLEVQTAEPPAPDGGPVDVARVQDEADLVVRDAKGNIKQQETVK